MQRIWVDCVKTVSVNLDRCWWRSNLQLFTCFAMCHSRNLPLQVGVSDHQRLAQQLLHYLQPTSPSSFIELDIISLHTYIRTTDLTVKMASVLSTGLRSGTHRVHFYMQILADLGTGSLRATTSTFRPAFAIGTSQSIGLEMAMANIAPSTTDLQYRHRPSPQHPLCIHQQLRLHSFRHEPSHADRSTRIQPA